MGAVAACGRACVGGGRYAGDGGTPVTYDPGMRDRRTVEVLRPNEVPSDYDPSSEMEMVVDNISMPEDMYGFALTSIFRDARMLSRREGNTLLRLGRLLASQAFILLCVATQAFILFETKLLVTAKRVHHIRDVYDKFEWHMYGEDESHTWITRNGKHRGFPEFFSPENFHTLDTKLKNEICLVSVSRPYFFMVILVTWSLTCIGEIKACVIMAWSIYCTPAVDEMANSMVGLCKQDGKGIFGQLRARLPPYYQERVDALGHNQLLVLGITRPIKAYLLFLFMLPRLLITSFLLWLGCRWLLATVGFEDVLLNAVALEFILVLKDLVFNTVLPERNKKEVQNTIMLPFGGDVKEKADCMRFFGSFSLLILAIVWVYLYMFHLQFVLPGYNWDIRAVCAAHMTNMLAEIGVGHSANSRRGPVSGGGQ